MSSCWNLERSESLKCSLFEFSGDFIILGLMNISNFEIIYCLFSTSRKKSFAVLKRLILALVHTSSAKTYEHFKIYYYIIFFSFFSFKIGLCAKKNAAFNDWEISVGTFRQLWPSYYCHFSCHKQPAIITILNLWALPDSRLQSSFSKPHINSLNNLGIWN